MAGLGWQPDATERIDIPHLHLPYVSQHGPLTTVVAPWSGCHYNVDNVGPDRHDVENHRFTHEVCSDIDQIRIDLESGVGIPPNAGPQDLLPVNTDQLDKRVRHVSAPGSVDVSQQLDHEGNDTTLIRLTCKFGLDCCDYPIIGQTGDTARGFHHQLRVWICGQDATPHACCDCAHTRDGLWLAGVGQCELANELCPVRHPTFRPSQLAAATYAFRVLEAFGAPPFGAVPILGQLPPAPPPAPPAGTAGDVDTQDTQSLGSDASHDSNKTLPVDADTTPPDHAFHGCVV